MKIKQINEASTSRLVHNFTNDDVSFAIISGERPDNDRTAELKKDVRNMGFGFNEFIGRWVEDGVNYDEKSLMITKIPFKQAFELGQKYNQSSIIYKNSDGCKEYCTTPFEDYSVGDVVRTYNINKDNPLNTKVASEIFSGMRGGPASQLKKGGNRVPFNFKENFELYEKELINSRLGFTESLIKFDD